MFDYVIERANANANIRLHTGYEDLTFAIICGDETTLLTVDGNGARFSDRPSADKIVFSMKASADAWREFRQAEPSPGFQTLSAMRRTQHLT